MPGPGGGSHGGGGSRGGGGGFSGGGFSGGSHGGGFNGGFNHHPGGGHRPPPPGPHFGGGWHRRRYYGGGGCSGGLFLAVIFILICVFSVFSSNNTVLTENVIIENVDQSIERYDENLFQDYANSQYEKEFGKTAAYEDNILLVFLAEDETYYDYYYIAWVGDHILTDINHMFGNEYTELGIAIENAINTASYKYSLDSNIAQVVEYMKNEVVAKNLESSFNCDEENAGYASHLTNNTFIAMTEETVNTALQSFTEETGIPIVVVVEDINDVFVTSQETSQVTVNDNYQSETVNTYDFEFSDTFFIIIAVVAVVVLIVVVIIRNKKKMKDLESDE